jgi:hypothetical protein
MAAMSALRIALSMADRPVNLGRWRRTPLPEGVTELLRVAVGDPDALIAAQALTGRSHAALQKATAFFIAQIMLQDGADSYRVLGVAPNAGPRELRRNMALLIKWLHPDGGRSHVIASKDCRELLICRVTLAWDDLKTETRRSLYDRSLRQNRKEKRSSLKSRQQESATWRGPEVKRPQSGGKGQRRASSRRLVVYRFEHATLWSRLMEYLWIRT